MRTLVPLNDDVVKYMSLEELKKWVEERIREQEKAGETAEEERKVVSPNHPSIDALINSGKFFYSNKKDKNGMPIGVAVALEEALAAMGTDGLIASLPYLIACKAKADEKHILWQNWYTALTEEDVGIDKQGRLFKSGTPVVVAVHGGGILTAERIHQAYKKGLTLQRVAPFSDEEFDNLLQGILPSGEKIECYHVEDVGNGKIPDPLGRYAIMMDFQIAQKTKSGYFKKKEFMENPLVWARAGTLDYLDAYFEKAEGSNKELGNHHFLGKIDVQQPLGRVLWLDFSSYGLDGLSNLISNGRWFGVAPEAHVARDRRERKG